MDNIALKMQKVTVLIITSLEYTPELEVNSNLSLVDKYMV